MANKYTHLCKYRKNKALAANKIISKEENNDWKVVIVYYSALHLIDSTYAENNVHPRKHIDRSSLMDKCNQYTPILDEYSLLEKLSRKARYDSLNIAKKEVTNALIALDKIEKCLINKTKEA